MPLIAKGARHGAATVDELRHDLVADMLPVLPARATAAFCRRPDRLHRPRRVPDEGSSHRFCRCEVTPDPARLCRSPTLLSPRDAQGPHAEDPRQPH